MLDFALYFFIATTVVAIFMWIMAKWEYIHLSRAIFIADRKLNFIKEVKDWSDNSKVYPFDKGIDPHDIYGILSDARDKGHKSLKKEISKYGNIEQI